MASICAYPETSCCGREIGYRKTDLPQSKLTVKAPILVFTPVASDVAEAAESEVSPFMELDVNNVSYGRRVSDFQPKTSPDEKWWARNFYVEVPQSDCKPCSTSRSRAKCDVPQPSPKNTTTRMGSAPTKYCTASAVVKKFNSFLVRSFGLLVKFGFFKIIESRYLSAQFFVFRFPCSIVNL